MIVHVNTHQTIKRTNQPTVALRFSRGRLWWDFLCLVSGQLGEEPGLLALPLEADPS